MFISQAKAEAIKATPALGGYAAYTFTLNEGVAIVTILYVLLQAAYLGWKWYREYKATKK